MRGIITGQDISVKASLFICKVLKGMEVKQALQYLRGVSSFSHTCNECITPSGKTKLIKGSEPIGMKFPHKTCRVFIRLIEQHLHNLGKDPQKSNLRIHSIYRTYGQAIPKRIFKAQGRSEVTKKQLVNIYLLTI